MLHDSRFFHIEELVPESVIDKFGADRSWWYIDPRAIHGLDILRKEIGKPFIVNNWKSGGDRSQSGLRLPGMSYYKPFSQHSFGRAFDILVDGMEPKELQEFVKDNYDRFGITGLEYAKTWTHIDFRGSEKLVEFWP